MPPDQVLELASIGCTDREIAAFFSIKSDTLRRNFAAELAKGREYIKTRLRMNMFRAADNLQPAILIFLSKNLLGYSDSPIDSTAKQPLPWVETEPTDLEITGDYNDATRETDAEDNHAN